MATFKGVNETRKGATPPQFADAGDRGGRVRHSYDEIDTTTAMTTSDVINLGEIPVGARVVGLRFHYAAHGSGRTVKIGDADDDDRYLAATSVASAGSTNAIATTGFGYKNETGNPVTIICTLAGGTLAAATKGLKLQIMYATE